MSLEDLAPELVSLILEAVDHPRDLYALIRASAAYFSVFAQSPERILSSVLNNAIQPNALRHALAVGHVPAALASSSESPETPDLGLPKAFLDKYFRAEAFEFPMDKAAIVELCRLFLRTSCFIDDYSTQAMSALNPEPDGAGQAATFVLSPTEQARFQRAFFRHELYSILFFQDPENPRTTRFPGNVQFTQFIARIEPWEAEEMSCVHQYFMSLVEGSIDVIDNELCEAVRGTPGARLSGTRRSQSPNSAEFQENNGSGSATHDSRDPSPPAGERKLTEGDDWQHHHDNDDMVPFDDLEWLGLDLFCNLSANHWAVYTSYGASLGSSFLHQLVLADGDKRRRMICKNVPILRDSLPEALSHAYRSGFYARGPNTVEPDIDDNQPSYSSSGYYPFRRSMEDKYLTTMYRELYRCPLRRRAYVFWDACLRPEVSKSLDAVAECIRSRKPNNLSKEGWNRKCPEDLLKGVSIPLETGMVSIMRKFSSSDESDPWFVDRDL